MRCLWLTLADPEPRYNGQFVYSGGLIDSVAATGSEIEVLGLRRPESRRSNGARDEHDRVVAAGRADSTRCTRTGAASLRCCRTSPIAAAPSACAACCDELLERGGWDGIVFDGISVGWALLRCCAITRRRAIGHG